MKIVMNFGGNGDGVWFGLNSSNGVLEFLDLLKPTTNVDSLREELKLLWVT